MTSYARTKVIRRRKSKPFRFSIARAGDKIHITGTFPYPLLKPLLILISLLLVLSTRVPGDTIAYFLT